MFRITANYDDRWHPLQGDVVTVASVAEALAAMPDGSLDEPNLFDLERGEVVESYGYGVTYIVERI